MLKVISWSSICPALMVFLFVMDHVFIINSTIFEAIALLASYFCTVNRLNRCIDNSYEYLFHMQKHEVNGFRRMRTFTQLMFESTI